MPNADSVLVDRQSPVILVRRGSQVMAFSRSCPHEQADLRWREADQRFQCPRHESKFKADGTLIGGRAKRAMDRLPIRRDGTSVVVNLAAPVRSDRQGSDWSAAILTV